MLLIMVCINEQSHYHIMEMVQRVEVPQASLVQDIGTQLEITAIQALRSAPMDTAEHIIVL